jgi:hypothetical protein
VTRIRERCSNLEFTIALPITAPTAYQELFPGSISRRYRNVAKKKNGTKNHSGELRYTQIIRMSQQIKLARARRSRIEYLGDFQGIVLPTSAVSPKLQADQENELIKIP